MRKNYFLLSICFALSLNAQVIDFPDANFKAKLLQSDVTNSIAGYIKIDANNDGEIEVSEIQGVRTLNVSGSSISDLTGLNYFNLVEFYCSYNSITDLSELNQQYLEILFCSNNQLTELPITGTALVDLNCSYNLIESLDLSTLGFTDIIDIHNNAISSFTPPEYVVRLDMRNNNFNGFTIPYFSIEAILYFGGNPSDALIYDGRWRTPKILVFSSDNATAIDLSNVPKFEYETDEGQPNFYFLSCPLLETIKLNNGLLSQDFDGSINIESCEELKFICADQGEEVYLIERLTNLGLNGQVNVSNDCSLSNPVVDQQMTLALFPNPAENILNVESAGLEIMSMEVYNLIGQSVMLNTTTSTVLDISRLPSGTYFLKIISNKGISNAKFIKK